MTSPLEQAVTQVQQNDYVSCKSAAPLPVYYLSFFSDISITAVGYDYSEHRSPFPFITLDRPEMFVVLTFQKEVCFPLTQAIYVLTIFLDRIYLGH